MRSHHAARSTGREAAAGNVKPRGVLGRDVHAGKEELLPIITIKPVSSSHAYVTQPRSNFGLLSKVTQLGSAPG